MKSSATIELTRPIDDVFDFVSNPENMERWVVGVGETNHVSGEGEGARYVGTYTYGGRTTEMTYEITHLDPPRTVRMVGEGPFPFEGEVTLKPTAAGTRVTNTILAGSDGAFTSVVFRLFRPIVRRLMGRQLAKELRMLKVVLEPEPSPTVG